MGMSILRFHTCFAIAGLALAVTQALAQPVIFSDNNFDESDWTAKIILNEVGGSAEFEARRSTFGGNPGAFRRVLHEGDGSDGNPELHVAHLRQGAMYDPQAAGPIDSISYSYDLINLEDDQSDFTDYYLLIFQNDAYYRVRPPTDRIRQRSWTPFGRDGLTPADFTRVSGSGPSRPDFFAAAAPCSLVSVPSAGSRVKAYPLGLEMMTAASAASTTGWSASSPQAPRAARFNHATPFFPCIFLSRIYSIATAILHTN